MAQGQLGSALMQSMTLGDSYLHDTSAVPEQRIHDQQLQQSGPRVIIQPARHQPMEPTVDLSADLDGGRFTLPDLAAP